jgi:hypothetical protein
MRALFFFPSVSFRVTLTAFLFCSLYVFVRVAEFVFGERSFPVAELHLAHRSSNGQTGFGKHGATWRRLLGPTSFC